MRESTSYLGIRESRWGFVLVTVVIGFLFMQCILE